MSSDPSPDAPPSGSFADELSTALGADAVSVAAERRQAASADYSWMSPVLARHLPATVADVVASPVDTVGVARALALAYRRRVAVVARGQGTGNYGQAVPLCHGLVIDADQRARVLDVGHGWIDAEAGTSFVRLEAAARATGQELAMFPSTVRSSLAGFLCGGAGGTGSLENGFIWDGFVQEIDVLPAWDVPEPITAAGDAVHPFLHAYGTTGVVVGARVKLAPARRWTALFASFASHGEAVRGALELADLEPRPRNLSVTDPALVAFFPADEAMPLDRVSVRATVEESTVGQARTLVAGAGGRVEAVRADAVSLLVSLSYNHVTLRAKRVRPELCHIQVGGAEVVARADEVRACLPGGMLHHDINGNGGTIDVGGLLIGRFVDDDSLATAMDDLRSLGARVIDPHTWMLGGHGSLDELRATSAQFDPLGLLNPRKLPGLRLSRAS